MAPPESDGSFVFTMSQGRQCWEMLGGVSAPKFFCSIGASKEHLHQAWRPYPWSWSNQSGRSGFTGHHSDRNMGFIRQSFSSISNHLFMNFGISWNSHIFHAPETSQVTSTPVPGVQGAQRSGQIKLSGANGPLFVGEARGLYRELFVHINVSKTIINII